MATDEDFSKYDKFINFSMIFLQLHGVVLTTNTLVVLVRDAYPYLGNAMEDPTASMVQMNVVVRVPNVLKTRSTVKKVDVYQQVGDVTGNLIALKEKTKYHAVSSDLIWLLSSMNTKLFHLYCL